jgi:Uma2 family endonuclease
VTCINPSDAEFLACRVDGRNAEEIGYGDGDHGTALHGRRPRQFPGRREPVRAAGRGAARDTWPQYTQLLPDILVFPATYKADTDWRKIKENWLAVEVLSRSSKIYDREFKKDAYFALGVRQVWLVDRWTKSIEVWRSPGSKKNVRDTLRWRAPRGDATLALELAEVFAGIS